MMINFTEEAKAQVLEALKAQQPAKNALRVEARDSGTDFAYALRLIGPEDRADDDRIFDAGGFEVVVDPASAENLKGATVTYEEGVLQSGFRFTNPNRPASQREDGLEVTGPLAEKVQSLLDEELNPAVAGHGGMIRMVGVRDNVVYLRFGGGCHGCGMVDVTLKHGVEARIREVLPEVKEVVDITDHRGGSNPYYS
jgi:Fe/S biogenesis protein NfuA